MATFYFTYSNDDSQPFRGGWTTIIAPDWQSAHKLFRKYHPDKTPGLLNCAATYNEECFFKTSFADNGNFGRFCLEHLEVRA